MTRPRQIRTLGIWMNGEHVGEWHSPTEGRHEFRYAPSWFESPNARPISIFFPLRPPSAPYRQGVESFFENVLSAHPMIGTGPGKVAPQKLRMAMAVWGSNRHYRWNEIHPRHWLETARQCGVTGMREIAEELCERTPSVLTQVQSTIPRGFPEPLANGILSGLKNTADTLRKGLAGIPRPRGAS